MSGHAGDEAAPERVRWPRLTATPDPRLRPLLSRGYAGFTEDTPSWPRRFALLDQFLLRRLDRGPRPAPEVGWAWQRLNASGGAAPIGELAREVGWSHKHLIARFRQQVGVAPKTAARLLRFNGVWRHLDEGRPLDWGLVAAETGYADQAHLIREFRQFTGTTPTGFQSQVNSVLDAAAAAS
jgi:AraC-like DNA-binding protein